MIPLISLVASVTGLLWSSDAADTGYLLMSCVAGMTYPVVGALIVTRRPKDVIGILFCLAGIGMALQALAGGYASYGQAHGWPGTGLAAWCVNWVWLLGFGPLLLLPLLLPDGRLPSPRWRPVLRLLVGAMALLQLGLMVRDRTWLWGVEWPNPYGFLPTGVVAAAFIVVGVGASVSGAVALAVRVRQADNRRQLMPVLAAASAFAVSTLLDAAFGSPGWSPVMWVQMLTVPLLPIAAAVSIFRYRLFDIEVMLRRTVVYVVVTGLLLGAYLATATALHGLIAPGIVEPLVATAVVAVAFAPVRDAVQQAVARLLFGSRGDPNSALSRLGQQLRASVGTSGLLDGTAETVARTLRLPGVTIVDAAGEEVSGFGEVPAVAVRVPLLAGGRREGELRAAARAPGESMSRADLAVLDELAGHLAVGLAAVRLAAEVQTSRERLVIAREEERRRLRRDLHDGLGPGLAAIGVRLNLIEATAPPELRGGLAEVRALTQGLVGDVRRVVHDLRPPALDELGLEGALDDLALAADGVRVEVRDPLPELSAAVGAAAYWIAKEALANALKHAQATSVTIALGLRGGKLVLTVRDDGIGFAEPVTEGVGSVSMRERAAEIGGSMRRTSAPGAGTTVEAVLPL
ncbi:sensor histidine kinase [Nonomuraea sp. NPDC046570]|uniref:sensor histidine kinase n=1 Tax=Nonomuraea sp. NPDC046570 TaxID=3155255 RepID=UPI0033F9B5C3